MSAPDPFTPNAGQPRWRFTLSHGVVIGSLLLALGLLLAPPAGLPASAALPAALVLVSIGLFATGIIPGHLTALLFFTLATFTGIAPPQVIFGGFAANAFWLIFGGLVLGVAVRSSGLGERLAQRAGELAGAHYPRLIAGVVAIGIVLGFLMPSSVGRAVLLIPLAVALAQRYGFSPGRNGYTGVVLAAAFGTHLPTFAVLPANVPNLVLSGAAETLYGWTPSYGHYLLLHFPILGLLKALVIIVLIVRLYPDRADPPPIAPARRPLSADERRLLWILLSALGLWMTDFLHHLSPAAVAMAAALLVLLPRIGLLPERAFNEINYASLFYVAGIMGIGALVAQSGLGALVARGLLAVLPLQPGQAMQNLISLVAVSAIVGLGTTLPGVPAVMTPLASDMASASGLSLEAVLMSQVLGFSTLLLPYQSAPLVVALALGGVPVAAGVRLALALGAVTLLLLLPLDLLWWRLLGMV